MAVRIGLSEKIQGERKIYSVKFKKKKKNCSFRAKKKIRKKGHEGKGGKEWMSREESRVKFQNV